MWSFIIQFAANTAGLWLASEFIPGIKIKVFGTSSFFGIPFSYTWQILILLGFVLALLDFFLKPVLKAITIPLRMLTLGVVSLLISMVVIWILDLLFAELTITGIFPLFYLTIIVWGLNLVIFFFFPGTKK